MTLANYINDLLYRYDCVIIPNFGGFVTNKISAKVNDFTNTFYPPKKQITFNKFLQHNDGLLTNYIASNKKISFENAIKFIEKEVAEWCKEIETKSVKVAAIGSLSLNDEKKIIFEPNTSSNFLTESYGLSSVESIPVKRFTREIKPLPIVIKEKENMVPVFIKRAAAAAVLAGITYVSWNSIQNKQQNELFVNKKKVVQKNIQSATFVIDNSLPTINLNAKKEVIKNFHIIVGAFQEIRNADKKLSKLKNQGYDAKIIGKNKFGLTLVSLSSFSTKKEAQEELNKVTQTLSKDAWLFIK